VIVVCLFLFVGVLGIVACFLVVDVEVGLIGVALFLVFVW